MRINEAQLVRERLAAETGTVQKDWGGRLPVALVYPNAYYVGMSNLGFQTVYGLLNAMPGVVCERAFYEKVAPDADGRGDWSLEDARPTKRRDQHPGRPLLLESQRPPSDAAALAFSVSYELDYFHLPAMLRWCGIPEWSAERDERHPIVVGGGPALMANPEPVADFFDAIAVGEAEPILPTLVEALRDAVALDRPAALRRLAEVPGVYVPSLHLPSRNGHGPDVKRLYAPDLDAFSTHSAVLTRDTELGDLFLMEVARGCGRGCRFCLAGYIFRPVRPRSLDRLLADARRGLEFRDRVGLVGPSVTDYEEIDELVIKLRELGAKVAFSSIRMERLSETIVRSIVESGTRTITLAPEVGTERLRRVIAKGMPDEFIWRAVNLVGRFGVRRLKLYYMVGLPTETEEDVQGIVDLTLAIKARLDAVQPGCQVVANVTPFVPKAVTPFQWESLMRPDEIRRRLQTIQRGLRPKGVQVRFESPEWTAIQAVLARGDRAVTRAIAAVDRLTIAGWTSAAESVGLDLDRYLYAERRLDEKLPWGTIDAGFRPRFFPHELIRMNQDRLSIGCPPGSKTCHACGVC